VTKHAGNAKRQLLIKTLAPHQKSGQAFIMRVICFIFYVLALYQPHKTGRI
jgi:hypothetical protein